MYRHLKISALLICISATACTSGNRASPIDVPYEAVQVAVDDALGDPAFVAGETIPYEWWTLFGDEQLNGFVEMGLARHPTIQSARAHILEAVYHADWAHSLLFPTFNYGGDILREKLSQTGIIPFDLNDRNTTGAAAPFPEAGGVAGIPVYFTQYETEITMSYHFDIWSKNRNTLRAAVGETRARMADEIFIRLQFSAAIAQVYFRLQINYMRQGIAKALVENQEKVSNLTQLRISNNIADKQPFHTSVSNIALAKQTLLQIQGEIAIQEYQLKNYLAGNFNEDITGIQIEEQSLPRVPLPLDLPLHLLARRPDITAQLWLIASAGRQIQVAKAGFYPDFSLTGLFGYQTIHLQKMFEWPSSFCNINPAFTLPIFDGGRLLANLRGTEVNYDQAIYDYNRLILNAVQEVLTGIAVLRNAEVQLKEYEERLKSQEDLFHLTSLRLTNNLASNLEYLTSEQNVLQARDQQTVALGAVIQAILGLIKALGGGYEACNENLYDINT